MYPCAVIETSPAPQALAARLDGSALAEKLRTETGAVAAAIAARGARPRLRVFLLGEDPASRSYVAGKTRAAKECGIDAETVALPADTRDKTLLSAIAEANRDPGVDGILVQLPLPTPELARRVFDALDPTKDVDGFHPENVGLLHQGRPRYVPCTPAGIH